MKTKNSAHLKNAVLGFAVGDALGVPFEFKARDTFKAADMVGYGTHNQPAGTWSDDSSMLLATLESLIECKKIDYDDIMQRFIRWVDNGDYCPYGECFDIGHTTLTAVGRFKNGYDPVRCGGRGFGDNGNGSLMRILPIAFFEHTVDDILNLSSLTHAHEISLMSCRLFVQLAENLMSGMTKEEAIQNLKCCVDECENIPKIASFPREKIRSTGYVVDTFEAAVWCLMTTGSYRECVLEAVNLGDDTDTVAAVAGALAGIYYGIGSEKGVPEEWINKLAKLDWINGLIDKGITAQ
ncbi:MAG: ADP-ribosylglycohydrolase family protein [Clostridia bacterium]|nr:ADP-ribosylglycohydrolase family protein [Clostridia bacterium]